MLFTIGRIDVYEPYLDSDPDAAKGKTGSVWETIESVREYMENGNGNLSGFRIYMVDADWEADTEFVPGETWRSLIRPAKLLRVEDGLRHRG